MSADAAAAAPLSAVPADGAPNEAAARRAAVKSGTRVEVRPARTEYSQLFAEPTGALTYETSVVPQRVHQRDGSWKNVDLTLAAGPDGWLRPKASVSDVRFSEGGEGPFARLTRGGKKMTLSWPLGALPKPTVAGDTATYARVLPDVDLVVRATDTGLSHLLVVKTAAAAANPKLQEVTFDLGGDTTVTRLPDGSLRAVAGTTLVAEADEPVMWDSSDLVAPARVAQLPGPAAVPGFAAPSPDQASDFRNTRSSAHGPGDAARVATLGAKLSGKGDLLLRPDMSLMGSGARFPVFIDPSWSTAQNKWAYATNNNSNNSDTSVARVGADPDSGKIYRSFFQFPIDKIAKKYVRSATVQMVLDHSWSCGSTNTSMFKAGTFTTPRAAWSTTLSTFLGTVASHANEGSGCADSPQPDMTVNWTNTSVTTMVNTAAKGSAPSVSVAFSARDSNGSNESDHTRWKKFFPAKAKLIADVDAIPGKPYGLQIGGIGCNSSGVKINTPSAALSAVVPDADTGQALKASFEWDEVPASGAWVYKGTAQASASAGSRASTTLPFTNGKTYAFRAYSTDPSPYSQVSPYSDWCVFTVDTTVPSLNPPVWQSMPSGPGQPGTVTLSSPDTDVVTFRYGWNESVTSSVATTTVAGVTGRSATVTVTAPRYGLNTLYVRALDSSGNFTPAGYTFEVGRPSPAVARWGLETYPGVDESAAQADSQPSLAGDTPLSPTSLTWTPDAHLVGGKSATFDGTSSQLATDSSVVDTTKSFSVAAWVRLGSPATETTVVAQEGSDAAGFALGTVQSGSPAAPHWSFTMRDTAAQSSTARVALSSTAADVGRWTHVAGVYDKAAGQIRLYVNGVLAGEVARTAAPWPADGRLTVGRGQAGGAAAGWFKGNVADVQAFDRVLVAQDFVGQPANDAGGVDEPGILAPVEVGRWDFQTAAPCYDASIPDDSVCRAPDAGTEWNRRLALTQGTGVGAGRTASSQGLALSDTHFVDDPADPFYGQKDKELGTSQRNPAAAGDAPSWQEGPVLRTDQSFTVSVWVQPSKLDTTMTAVAQRGTKMSPFYLGTRKSTVNGVTGPRFEVMTVNTDQDLGETYAHAIAPTVLGADDLDDYTHLVMVYDAEAKEVRLYVDGVRAGDPIKNWTGWNAAGPLSVGSAWWSSDNSTGAWYDQWFGGIDDLNLYQGAMNDAQVADLHEQQISQ
ncbi:LamG-like jellyroll fold domain-containing protein [Krasilnikovia sp. MM14-A1259]|uniref:LamG-like jellyroll fold domain-containing protein n=1 Tax=Krasilnikovia sp. MM14-A1259 TaxID=3373539 RepID=UPI00380305EC